MMKIQRPRISKAASFTAFKGLYMIKNSGGKSAPGFLIAVDLFTISFAPIDHIFWMFLSLTSLIF